MTLATALFGISVQLLVTTEPPIVVDNLTDELDNATAETLRVDWDVRKQIGSSADECTVQVTNLSPTSRAALAKARRSGRHYPKASVTRVSLSVGWGGVPEPLYLGEVVSFEAGRQSGADIVSTISCLTGGVAAHVPPAGGSEFGLAASGVLITEAARLGHAVTPAVLALVEQEASARAITAWQRPADQEPRTLLSWLFATLDLSWGIDPSTNAIAAYKHGQRLDVPGVVLRPSSGLLSWTESDGGIQFEALAQPGVVPGCQLTFLDEAGIGLGPPLRCESVEFSGSTEGPSLMRGVAKQIEVIQ